jgi:hypothetical protein
LVLRLPRGFFTSLNRVAKRKRIKSAFSAAACNRQRDLRRVQARRPRGCHALTSGEPDNPRMQRQWQRPALC